MSSAISSSSEWISSRRSKSKDTKNNSIKYSAPINDCIAHECSTIQTTCDVIAFIQIEHKRLCGLHYVSTTAPSPDKITQWINYVLPPPQDNQSRAQQHIMFKKEYRKSTNNDRRYRSSKVLTKTPLQTLHKCVNTRCYITFRKLLLHFLIEQCYKNDNCLCVGITKYVQNTSDSDEHRKTDDDNMKQHNMSIKHNLERHSMVKNILLTLCKIAKCMLQELIAYTL